MRELVCGLHGRVLVAALAAGEEAQLGQPLLVVVQQTAHRQGNVLGVVARPLVPGGERGAAVSAEDAAVVPYKGRGERALDTRMRLVGKLRKRGRRVPCEGHAEPEGEWAGRVVSCRHVSLPISRYAATTIVQLETHVMQPSCRVAVRPAALGGSASLRHSDCDRRRRLRAASGSPWSASIVVASWSETETETETETVSVWCLVVSQGRLRARSAGAGRQDN
jgi:hypothetical protein